VFNLKRNDPQPTDLDLAIAHYARALMEMPTYSDGAVTTAVNVKTLCDAQASLWEAQRTNKLSADTITTVIGSLAGIGMILSYEHVNVITSKALGFVMKPKV
jgi:hypothetical protein